MGPILLFDKSTLQSLSVDESVWLEIFYLSNITPLFFVETLADLEKEVVEGRTPEQVVGNLAKKTPSGGLPNVHHNTLCVGELLGSRFEIRGVPIIAGGRPVVSGERRGIVFDQPPEITALQRWMAGQFLDVERDFARAWRRALSGVNLEDLYQQGRALIRRFGRPRDLAEAKSIASTLLEKPGSRAARAALDVFAVSERDRREVIGRWKQNGEPPMNVFAPYCAHVLTVDLFFVVALGADLISRDRPSNKIDIAYLYYLPLCHVFTSNDSLHARTAGLFMTEKQAFVPGHTLKADLARLDAYYSALPDDVRERGVMSFAYYPPTEGDFLVAGLWDNVMKPEWRQNATRPREPLSEETRKKLIAHMDSFTKAPPVRGGTAEFTSEDADAVMMGHNMPIRKGKWRMLPPEAEGVPER